MVAIFFLYFRLKNFFIFYIKINEIKNSRGWLAESGERLLTNPAILVRFRSKANRQDFFCACGNKNAQPQLLKYFRSRHLLDEKWTLHYLNVGSYNLLPNSTKQTLATSRKLWLKTPAQESITHKFQDMKRP